MPGFSRCCILRARAAIATNGLPRESGEHTEMDSGQTTDLGWRSTGIGCPDAVSLLLGDVVLGTSAWPCWNCNVGLGNLQGPFSPQPFYDSVIRSTCSLLEVPAIWLGSRYLSHSVIIATTSAKLQQSHPEQRQCELLYHVILVKQESSSLNTIHRWWLKLRYQRQRHNCQSRLLQPKAHHNSAGDSFPHKSDGWQESESSLMRIKKDGYILWKNAAGLWA